MNPTTITFTLQEPKKHSGKYVQDGTENDRFPNMMYFRKEWFPNNQLPTKVKLTVESIDD